jgi:3-dehydroquinate synthase
MVGLFHQPEFVICDPELLKTLPRKEISCGLAEIAKHAAIADADLFAYLEKHAEDILALDRQAIEKLVRVSVRIKSSIVSRDETEKDAVTPSGTRSKKSAELFTVRRSVWVW